MANATIIRVKCTDQELEIVEAPVVASGGKNEVKMEFTFCEKWNGLEKSGVFYVNKDNPYYAPIDENDTCIVPWQVYQKRGKFTFGAIGEKDDGVVKTSATLRYTVREGAPSAFVTPDGPSQSVPDIYNDFATKQWVQEGYQPKGNYLTQHQDISGKLDKTELPTAINTALAQAKESGEFKGDPGNDYILTPADKREIAELAADMVDVPESGAGCKVKEIVSAGLNIEGYVKYDGSLSGHQYSRRTDYIPTADVVRIYGNAGFYVSLSTIALFDANKAFLKELSVKGERFIENINNPDKLGYDEGFFEVDISGEEYADAAYFVVSSLRWIDFTNIKHTFEDDYCRYVKLVDLEQVEVGDCVRTVNGKTPDENGNVEIAASGSSQNGDFKTDKTLSMEDGVLSVNTTNAIEQDNTLPITSAGVYAAVGNIEELLKTI